ncbi:O-antigen ligase family protein [Stutzerimonas nitrititolerans]|uniref:O-antigen ligase family protein n=1 Tax=Stutzerimonas nitrititolerans TaxID=2482751 RepID=UPI002899B2CF|nr:O-antigen ligase family protein [Stutzerimonas nitrititolerans]
MKGQLLRFDDILVRNVLPFGLVALMTGMFWIGDRSDYHRVFYILVALPTFIALLARPHRIAQGASSPIFIVFLAFSGYVLLSILWSGTDKSFGTLLKRPLYIALLFYCVAVVILAAPDRINTVLRISIAGAVCAALISIIVFYGSGGRGRLDGYGALYNPLLTSHVYGCFAALALGLLSSTEHKREHGFLLISIALLAVMLLATGSRTPLVGITATVIWIVMARADRRALWVLAATCVAALLLVAFMPESVTSRGLSYRPEIWKEAWSQISQKPWLGYGYDHPMVFPIKGIEDAFADPHNMELAILFSGGVVGFVLWLALYTVSLWFAWNNRHTPLVVAAAAALVYGFAAGLTEGNSFMSRPKEHWFLIWIPFALLAGASLAKRYHAERH